MRKFIQAACAALAISGAVSGAAAPAAAEELFKTGNWRGGAVFNGTAFTHCFVRVPYRDRRILTISLAPNLNMAVMASKPEWNMNPSQTYDVRFEFTSGLNKTYRGVVTAERRNQIIFRVGNDSALRQAFTAEGNMTWIDQQGERFPFSLINGANAMRKLLACAALYGVE